MLLQLTEQIPEIRWKHGDDLCDCTFQRIGYWTNPYLAKTLEFRMCCAWKTFGEMFPEIGQFIREIPAFDNYNENRWVSEPMEWNTDYDMPRALWYRQLAVKTGKTLDEIRQEYAHLNPPKAVLK